MEEVEEPADNNAGLSKYEKKIQARLSSYERMKYRESLDILKDKDELIALTHKPRKTGTPKSSRECYHPATSPRISGLSSEELSILPAIPTRRGGLSPEELSIHPTIPTRRGGLRPEKLSIHQVLSSEGSDISEIVPTDPSWTDPCWPSPDPCWTYPPGIETPRTFIYQLGSSCGLFCNEHLQSECSHSQGDEQFHKGWFHPDYPPENPEYRNYLDYSTFIIYPNSHYWRSDTGVCNGCDDSYHKLRKDIENERKKRKIPENEESNTRLRTGTKKTLRDKNEKSHHLPPPLARDEPASDSESDLEDSEDEYVPSKYLDALIRPSRMIDDEDEETISPETERSLIEASTDIVTARYSLRNKPDVQANPTMVSDTSVPNNTGKNKEKKNERQNKQKNKPEKSMETSMTPNRHNPGGSQDENNLVLRDEPESGSERSNFDSEISDDELFLPENFHAKRKAAISQNLNIDSSSKNKEKKNESQKQQKNKPEKSMETSMTPNRHNLGGSQDENNLVLRDEPESGSEMSTFDSEISDDELFIPENFHAKRKASISQNLNIDSSTTIPVDLLDCTITPLTNDDEQDGPPTDDLQDGPPAPPSSPRSATSDTATNTRDS